MAEFIPAVLPPPPVQPAPSPPSAPGIEQPVFGSGSATSPAPPIHTTGNPVIPPPEIGDPEGVPTFPPAPPETAPVDVPLGPLVGPAATSNLAGPPPPPYPPSFASGSATFPGTASWFPQFTTEFPAPPIVVANIQMIGMAPVPETDTDRNVILDGWGPPGPQITPPPGGITPPGGFG